MLGQLKKNTAGSGGVLFTFLLRHRYVMSLKKSQHRQNGKTYWGTHKNVSVGVYTKNGFISTIFPNYIQKGVRKYAENEK